MKKKPKHKNRNPVAKFMNLVTKPKKFRLKTDYTRKKKDWKNCS